MTYKKLESTSDKKERKEKKKDKKFNKRHKSYLIRVIKHKDDMNIFLFIIMCILGFVLDVLRIIKNLILGLVVIGIISGVCICVYAWIKVEPYYTEYNNMAKELVKNSDMETFKLGEATYIYDTDGNILAKLRGEEDSSYLKYEDIPVDAINAFIAVEDRTFWDNPGIDIKGLTRVVVDFVKTRGEEMHGASTITQQLARNIFLTHEVSIERKVKEIFISFQLTEKYSKKNIMEFYVNDICFANAMYGLEAASHGYFDKPSNELSLSEIAYLCAIPNSPEYYNPYKYPDRALSRRDKILGDMLELEYITESEYYSAINEKITIKKPELDFKDYQSTYAIDCATRYLMKVNGFEFRYTFENMTDYNNYKKEYNEIYEQTGHILETGGYKIYTTLDSNIQADMQDILDTNLEFESDIDEDTGVYKLQGAITVVNNFNGKVIAVIGGRSQESDIETYTFNRAYQSTRQPGSTIKPLAVYTPALMSGYTPNTTVYNIDVTKAKEKGVDVQSLRGPSMTLRSALEQSKNGVAWQIFDKLGAKEALSYINNMEFASICPDDYYNSSSLGGLTYGVTTVEMASAYATLEGHGWYREPTCISKMIDSSGVDIYRDELDKQIYSEKAADTMVDMMTGVLTNGTASGLNWYNSTKMVAACKTGTTNDSKDGWLCGFTPYYTVAVWVGYDTPKTLNNLYGATYPGRIWKDCMLSLIEDCGVIEDFEKSEEYYEVTVNRSDDIPESAYDKYLPGRDDSEELAEGYTVYDYREDRVKGDGLEPVINSINSLDISDPDYSSKLQQLYSSGLSVVNSIYSQKYKAELQGRLDEAYNNKLGQ